MHTIKRVDICNNGAASAIRSADHPGTNGYAGEYWSSEMKQALPPVYYTIAMGQGGVAQFNGIYYNQAVRCVHTD